jgi:hypothetical protein
VTAVDALFEEFVSRWSRDEPVDVEDLLARAGPGTNELARLIDTFLERAPRREPSKEARATVASLAAGLEGEPPLVAARVASRQRVADVTAAIVSVCGLPANAEKLVRSYYQRLEGGLLDPKGVSDRVWSVLERVLGPAARTQAEGGFSNRLSIQQTLAFQRPASAEAPAFAAPAGVPVPDELPETVRREVEELFTGRGAPH